MIFDEFNWDLDYLIDRFLDLDSEDSIRVDFSDIMINGFKDLDCLFNNYFNRYLVYLPNDLVVFLGFAAEMR